MSKKTWTTQGFEGFRKGTFGNGGQNIYVSKKGVLQRIFQYDLDKNGYIDLVFANCQNHHESTPAYVYNTKTGERDELPAQGSYCGMVLDIDGDGYQDIVVAGYYDMAAPFASTDIYFGTKDGYSENNRIRIPTPWTFDCCHGDFKGNGKQILSFAEPAYKRVRLFEKTKLDCYEWEGYTDFELPTEPWQITATDLDGDGFDDLVVRDAKTTETVVYWGSSEGLSAENKTVLPARPESEIANPEVEIKITSDAENVFGVGALLQAVKWNGKSCFTMSTGKKVYFFTANKYRQLEVVLEFDVKFALSVAVGDIDGDGYDDIAVGCLAPDPNDETKQQSFILWNGADGFDKKSRTVVDTFMCCDVDILEGKVLFAQGNVRNSYTHNSKLFTYPDFENPQLFVGEDTRRGYLIKNPDEEVKVVLIDHFARSAIGFEESYIYWGTKDGYSPENMTEVPCHCGVDALIADFNDDGWAELLIANNSENSMHLDVGHQVHFFGPNGFEPEKSYNIITDGGWGVCAGDFDHDGYLEIATPGNVWKEMRIYSAKDNFSTYKTVELPEGCSVRWPAAVDINMDGWLDLILPCGGKNAIILWGGPEGYSMERSMELATYHPIGVSAADLSKNGYPDLIIGGHTATGRIKPDEPHHSFVYIYWNGPEGLSESRKCVLRGDAADHMAVADFNGDGWLDLFAGSYHGGKDRDVNSFLYWNREGKFRELDRDLLYTHSASGCMAADFNEDGYIDLVVANHKVDGDHKGYSSVWWNGEKGFNSERCTHLPTNGPHGMITTEIGNILDRSYSEYYYSESYIVDEDCVVSEAVFEGEVPEKTAVNITVRVNGGEWVKPEGVELKKGDTLEYRVELYAYNGLTTPRITKIEISFK